MNQQSKSPPPSSLSTTNIPKANDESGSRPLPTSQSSGSQSYDQTHSGTFQQMWGQRMRNEDNLNRTNREYVREPDDDEKYNSLQSLYDESSLFDYEKYSNPNTRDNLANVNNLQNNEELMGEASTGFLSNHLFLNCLNSLLKYSEKKDVDMINFLKTHGVIDYKSEHFQYIQSKISKFVGLSPQDYESCLKQIKGYKQLICNGAIINLSIYCMSNVFTFFSVNNDIYRIKKNTDEYNNFKKLYKIFLSNGQTIMKKTIDISKFFEQKYCGQVSLLTEMMEDSFKNFMPTKATVESNQFDKTKLKFN